MQFRQLLLPLAFALGGLAVAAVWLRPTPPVVEPSSRGSEPPEAARFHAAYQETLARRLHWNYVDLELEDIARDLTTRLQFPIEVDRENAAKLPWTKKLTLVADDLSVRNGLEFLLQPTLLAFTPQDGKLLITSDAVANSAAARVVRCYFAPDLRQPLSDVTGKWRVNVEPLRDLIQQHFPDSLAEADQTRSPAEDENYLWLRQSLDGHEQIEALLEGLRRVNREYAADPRVVRTQVVDLQPPDPTIEVRARRGDIAFEGSLEDWGRAVEKSYGLYVHLFPPVLIDPGLPEPRVLKGDLKQARLDEMLDHFLKPHRLQYRLRPDAIVIFVPFGDPGYDLRMRAFPVWDLAPSRAPDARSDELEKLAAAVREQIQAEAADWAGGPGAIDTWLKPATLIVTNTEANLGIVAKTLERIRAMRRR